MIPLSAFIGDLEWCKTNISNLAQKFKNDPQACLLFLGIFLKNQHSVQINLTLSEIELDCEHKELCIGVALR